MTVPISENATQLLDSDKTRRGVYIFNNGPQDVYIGSTQGQANPGNGVLLPVGTGQVFLGYDIELWAGLSNPGGAPYMGLSWIVW